MQSIVQLLDFWEVVSILRESYLSTLKKREFLPPPSIALKILFKLGQEEIVNY